MDILICNVKVLTIEQMKTPKQSEHCDIESNCMDGIWFVGYCIGKIIKLNYLLCKGIYYGCAEQKRK
jgi:hypothetical protein